MKKLPTYEQFLKENKTPTTNQFLENLKDTFPDRFEDVSLLISYIPSKYGEKPSLHIEGDNEAFLMSFSFDADQYDDVINDKYIQKLSGQTKKELKQDIENGGSFGMYIH